MKRIVALLLVCLLSFGLVACSKAENTESGKEESQEVSEAPKLEIADSTEALTKVWELYTTDEKFPAMGGDAENIVNDAPGAFNVAKAEDLGMESTLCFPTAELSKIDNAASLVHGMMVNNFTAGAYHVTDAANTQAVVAAIKDKVANNQWMCGMPETLIIATIGDNYVVSAFGLKDNIDTFKAKLSEAYAENVSIVVDEAIVE